MMDEKNDPKVRILQVHNFYQVPGGEDTVVANEKKLLEQHGNTVIQYTRSNDELHKFTIFRKILLPFITIFNPRTYFEVKKIIKDEEIDIVHVHNTLSLISPSVYYAALKCKKPVVQTMHNFRLLCPDAIFYRDGHICEECVEHGFQCAIRYKCYRNSRALTILCVINTLIHRTTKIYGKVNYICLTEFNRNKLLKIKQIKPEKVFIKPNFTYCKDYPQIQEKKYYLVIGRVELIKGIDILIEAFKELPEQKLVIAGNGKELEYYKEIVLRKEIENIDFCGYLSGEKLEEKFFSAKGVIVASQCYESFGMVIIEAFAHGIPVIVGDIGNIASLVTNGINGIKFKYNSPTALVEAIKDYEKMDTDKMGKEAYKTFQNFYSDKENYILLKKIYFKIVR